MMAPTDRNRTSSVNSGELLALSKAVASINTNIEIMSHQQLPAVAADTREARDGVIRLAVAHSELSKRVDVVENTEPDEHGCYQEEKIAAATGAISAQEKQLAGLTGKWKWVAGVAVALVPAIIGAYVTMNRSDAQMETRVQTVERSLERHEKSFESIDKTLTDDRRAIIDEVKALPVKVLGVVRDETSDGVATMLTEREQREFLRLRLKIENGDR